jgi:hypothetical protein
MECGTGLIHHGHPAIQPVPTRGEGDLTPILFLPSITHPFLHLPFLAFVFRLRHACQAGTVEVDRMIVRLRLNGPRWSAPVNRQRKGDDVELVTLSCTQRGSGTVECYTQRSVWQGRSTGHVRFCHTDLDSGFYFQRLRRRLRHRVAALSVRCLTVLPKIST